MMKPDECQYRCPELDACINATVWCDGIEDCPSGVDEALTHCSIIFKLPPVYLFFGSLILLLAGIATCVIVWRMCRRRPRSILQTRLKSLSSDTAIVDEKGVICWHSDNSVRYVEVDRVTTVWRFIQQQARELVHVSVTRRIGRLAIGIYWII